MEDNRDYLIPVPQKRKEALRNIIKENIRKAGRGVRFCCYLTWFMRGAGLLLGLGNILYAFLVSGNMLDLLFLLITAGFPIGLSFLPAAAYRAALENEYFSRVDERIELFEDGFWYSYYDGRPGFQNMLLFYHIRYSAISQFYCDRETRILSIHGDIDCEVCDGQTLVEKYTCEELALVNMYEEDLAGLILQWKGVDKE